MTYKDIIGQQEAKQRLIRMVNDDRVPHALLFTGAEGCGNLPLALAFAQHLFCNSKTPDGACGKCPSCLKVSKLSHPDLHISFPIAKSKDIKHSDHLITRFRESFLLSPYLRLNEWFDEINSENKQPVIAVDEASLILNKLSYTSYEGSYKIVIMWQPECMTVEAANRLLKILEEPPEKTIFILVTNAADQLLATILSRVQQIPFFQCSNSEISEALIKQHGVSQEAATQIAMMANGNYGEALDLVKHSDEHASLLADFQNFMRIALRFDAVKALEWIEVMAKKGREGQKQFLLFGLEIFRDCLLFRFGSKDLVRLSGAQRVFLEKFAQFVTDKNYTLLIQEFDSNYYYIERNANSKMIFMDLFLKTNGFLNQK